MPRPPFGRAPRPPLGRAPVPWRNWGRSYAEPQVYYVTELPGCMSYVRVYLIALLVLVGLLVLYVVNVLLVALANWIDAVAAYTSSHPLQILGGAITGLLLCAVVAATIYAFHRAARKPHDTMAVQPDVTMAVQPVVNDVTIEARSEDNAPPIVIHCAQCKTPLPDEANFCPKCGQRRRRATRVFAIANQKGRVGKTTTAINLAACLASVGRRTLIVDLSPDAEATTSLGVDPQRVDASIYELLVSDSVTVNEVLKRDLRPNLSLLPAKVDLYAADIELVNLDQREYRLKRILESVKGDHEFVLIDCPSSLSLLTINALTAADGVILPLPCEYFAVSNVVQLLNTIRLVRDRLNPAVSLFGVVLTMYDPRTRLAAEVVDEIRQHFPEERFQTLIPQSIRLSEAPSLGLTILEHDARSPGAVAYKNLAEEVIARAASIADADDLADSEALKDDI